MIHDSGISISTANQSYLYMQSNVFVGKISSPFQTDKEYIKIYLLHAHRIIWRIY